MMIGGGFDEANKERRERIEKYYLNTAKKLSERVNHFFIELDRNYSLNKEAKAKIKKQLIENINQ